MDKYDYGDKIIAEFIEAVIEKENVYFKSIVFKEGRNFFKLWELKFHNEWNWLMPVVEHIEKMDAGNHSFFILESIGLNAKFILDDGTRILKDNTGETKLQAVYNAVVAFIEWHNSNSK